MVQMFSASNINTITTDVKNALPERQAGDDQRGLQRRRDYEILAQTYSAPLPLVRRLPLPGDRLHAPDDRRLRRLEQRRQLGAQHGRRHAQQHGQERRRRHVERARCWTMVGALYGRRLCENTVGLLEEKGVSTWQSAGRRRQDRVGAPDPHAHDDLPARTSCRRTGTRTTGASSRCATASARPTTAARRAAATARAAPGSTRKGEPNMTLHVEAYDPAHAAPDRRLPRCSPAGSSPRRRRPRSSCAAAAARCAGRARRPLDPARPHGRKIDDRVPLYRAADARDRAADRRRRGRAGLPVDRHARRVPRDLRAAAARPRSAARRQPRDRRLGADRLPRACSRFAGRTTGSAFARRAGRCAHEIEQRYGAARRACSPPRTRPTTSPR